MLVTPAATSSSESGGRHRVRFVQAGIPADRTRADRTQVGGIPADRTQVGIPATSRAVATPAARRTGPRTTGRDMWERGTATDGLSAAKQRSANSCARPAIRTAGQATSLTISSR